MSVCPYYVITFKQRSHLQGSRSPLKMGPIGCPETSVQIYHSTLRNTPEECRSHPHRCGSLRSPRGPLFKCFCLYIGSLLLANARITHKRLNLEHNFHIQLLDEIWCTDEKQVFESTTSILFSAFVKVTRVTIYVKTPAPRNVQHRK